MATASNSALKINPHASWLPLAARASETSNPRHRTLLEEVAAHMEAEIKAQLDPLMETLTAQPVYHFWRVGGANMVLEGYDAVRGFYANMFENNGQQFEVVVERILVDDGGVITEGQVKQVYQRDALVAMGVTEIGTTPTTDHELWLSNAQLITVWPGDADAKLVGEDIYFGEDPMTTLAPITQEEIPDYYIL